MIDILFKSQAILFSLALNGLLAFGAYRFAGMVVPGRGRSGGGLSDLDRLVVMLATFVVAVPAVTIGLGVFGVLGRWTALACVVVFAAVAYLASSRSGGRRAFAGPLVMDALGAIRQDRALVVGILPGVVTLLLLLGWAAPRPSYGFDPLNYHLPLAAAVFRTGGLMPVHFPPYFETFPYFTMTGDMFSVWAMLSTGDTSLLPLANMAPFALLAVVLYGFLRDSFPSRAAAAAMTSALLTVPAFFVLLTDAYVEIPLWAFMFGSMRLIFLSARNGHDRGLFVLASFLCGAMIGAKLTGFPMALVLFAVWIAMSRGRGVAWHLGRLGIFLVGVALFGSYFYFRNIWLTGSPVYPFPMSIAGLQVFPGDADHAARVAGTTISRFLAPLVFSGEIFKAVFGTRTPPNSSWGLGATGPFFIASAVLAALAIVRAALKRARAAGGAGGDGQAWLGPIFLGASLLAIVVYIFLPWCAPYLFGNVRFLYPAVPFAAFAVASVPAIAGIKRWAVVVACLILQAVSFVAASVPLTVAGLIVAAVTILACASGAGFSTRPWFRRLAGWLPAAVLVVVVVVAVSFRLDTVQAYRDPGSSAGPAKWASDRAGCAEAIARHSPEGPFALTMARGAPHAWFIFPLLGERLQREPVYVNVSPSGAAGCLKCADAWPGWPDSDMNLWMRGLDEANVDALVIMNDDEDVQVGRAPVELEWVKQNPDRFAPIYTGRFCSVYRLAGLDHLRESVD